MFRCGTAQHAERLKIARNGKCVRSMVYGKIGHGMGWCGVVRYGMVWCGMV